MSKCYIIAEIGCNHNGDKELAKQMVKVACECGVDAVKFQTFNSEALISKYAPKAEYQKITTGEEDSQLEMTKKLELSHSDYLELKEYAEAMGVDVFSTPFDMESIDFLYENGQKTWKIPSGEITNLPYLEKIGALDCKDKRIILSTGMATIDEIKKCIEVLIQSGTKRDSIVLLHCNTEYPTPDKDVNLSAIKDLRDNFCDLQIGFSDHSSGVIAAVGAMAFDVKMIEKHFTLDKNMPGPDQMASANPEELKMLCDNVRRMEVMLGVGKKIVTPSEEKNKIVARKSIVATCNIKKGDVFSVNNLTCKRPGNGISPMRWYDLLGKVAEKDFEEDELITATGFEEQNCLKEEVKNNICVIDAVYDELTTSYNNLSIWGKAVITYPIRAALESELFDKIYLHSDSDYTKYIVRKSFGCNVSLDYNENDIDGYNNVCWLSSRAVMMTSQELRDAYHKWNCNGIGVSSSQNDLIKFNYDTFFSTETVIDTTNAFVFTSNSKNNSKKIVNPIIVSKDASLVINSDNDFELAIVLQKKRYNEKMLYDNISQRIQQKKHLLLNKEKHNKSCCLVGHSQLDDWNIEQLAGYRVRNCGIGGISSFQYNELILSNNLLDCNADLFIVMHGTNDIVYNYTDDEICKSILNTIDYIKRNAKGVPIIFIKCLHTNGRKDRNNQRIDMLNNCISRWFPNDVIIVEVNEMDDQYGNLDERYTTDGLHLNVMGYEKLNDLIEKAIQTNVKWE